MHDGKLSKAGGIFLGIMFSIFGLWGILAKEYSHDGNMVRAGWHVKGDAAVIIGSVVLLYGLYILYLSLRPKK